MMIAMREADGMMDEVIDTEVEPGALMYVTQRPPTSSLTFVWYRSGIEIGTLVITEIDRGTDIGTTMDTARAVEIDRGTDGNLGIETRSRTTEGGVVIGILGLTGMTLANELEGGEKDLLTLGAKEEETTVGIGIRKRQVGKR